MKRFYFIIAGLLQMVSVFAQAPQKMSYQAVIRNSSNVLVAATTVGMKISVLQGSATGIAWYIERQTPTTNANGLASIEIGSGTALDGTFSGINWAAGPYFIKTETDPTGGTNYTIVGTNQLMSVPYALFSANGLQGLGGFSHYIGEPYLGGLVYHLYRGSDGVEHGLIVSLTEGNLQWQTVPTTVNASSTTDGAFNTALMTNSPAATYIASLGNGWYLPVLDELRLLFFNRYLINKALFAGGNNVLSSSAYWTSIEVSPNFTQATSFRFDAGLPSPYSKTITNGVRGVKAF